MPDPNRPISVKLRSDRHAKFWFTAQVNRIHSVFGRGVSELDAIEDLMKKIRERHAELTKQIIEDQPDGTPGKALEEYAALQLFVEDYNASYPDEI